MDRPRLRYSVCMKRKTLYWLKRSSNPIHAPHLAEHLVGEVTVAAITYSDSADADKGRIIYYWTGGDKTYGFLYHGHYKKHKSYFRQVSKAEFLASLL